MQKGFFMEIGKKIRELRMWKGLTQEELADRSELSKGFISQLENEPSLWIATLSRFDASFSSVIFLIFTGLVLTCLGTDLKTFFGEEQDNQVVFCEEDYFVKTAEAQGNEIAWIVPNAQKNRMEPIRLTLQSGACTEIDSPHEGEEFGYVLSGRILLHLGDVITIWKIRVKHRPSFSGSVHRLIFRFFTSRDFHEKRCSKFHNPKGAYYT